MSVHRLKRGDRGFPIKTTLSDEAGPIPLLGATVRFKMAPAPESDGTSTVNAVATIIDPAAGLGDPDLGKVEYVWLIADTDTGSVGVYRAEWEVTFGDGSIETFPSGEWDDVIIHPDL